MSSWEIMQELADSVKTVVASVDELSATGIDLSGPARTLTASGGTAAANTIAATIASSFQPQVTFDSCVAIDLTNQGWTAAIAAFRAFCLAFLPWVQAGQSNADAARGALRRAATTLVQFSSGGLADVGALTNAIADIPGVPANAVQSIRAASAALRACVLSMSVGRDYQSAMGISIFAPGSAGVYISNRSDYVRLQFSNLTGWGAILDMLYGFGRDNTRYLSIEDSQLPFVVPGNDAEFVVSLRGFPIDEQTGDQIETMIRRTVLEQLAQVDVLGDVTVTPASTVLDTRRPGIPLGLVCTQLIAIYIFRIQCYSLGSSAHFSGNPNRNQWRGIPRAHSGCKVETKQYKH